METIKILCEGEKIIRKGFFNDDYIPEKNQTFYDDIEFGWIGNKTKHEVYNNNGKCALKTEELIKKELLKNLQGQMLVKLKPLQDAITFQEMGFLMGNNLKERTISSELVKQWMQYIEIVATIDSEIDLNDYSIEEINPQIFGMMPDLPDVYKKLL